MFNRARRFFALANMAATLSKTEPAIGSDRVRQHLQSRINPIRNLTPASLVSSLENFDRGYLRNAAQLWQKIKDRDDAIQTVAAKRELGVSLLDWEIITMDETPEADLHKTALEDFYNTLTTTNALDTNERGGVAKLIKYMMHAVGHKYAVHEIVWQPAPGSLSAEFRFVPLQFFENTEGRLRFLETDFATTGIDLEAGGWMVTCGQGLMEASAIAYLYKKLPLQSWLILCEKFAVPYLHGTTSATFGSAEWDGMRDALAAFSSDGSVLTSAGSDIKPIQISGNDTPQKELVDRMDRAITRLWLGGDLSTMSQLGDATGSDAQSKDGDIFEAADALNISETLQHYVDKQVIDYRFGTEPRAYFKLQPSVREDLTLQIQIDTFMRDSGIEQSKGDLRARYGRADPEAGEEVASAPSGLPSLPGAPPLLGPGTAFANTAPDDRGYLKQAAEIYAPAIAAVVKPLLDDLQTIEEITDPTAQRAALEKFRDDLPATYRDAIKRVPAAAEALEKILGPALVSGFTVAAQTRQDSAA